MQNGRQFADEIFNYILWMKTYEFKVKSNYMNPGYFTLAAIDLKPQQMPMFLHISPRVWGRRWSPHTSEQRVVC